MKIFRNAVLHIAAAAVGAAFAATTYDIGVNDAGTPFGAKVSGAVATSTNATQVVTVKCVVDFPMKSVTNTLYTLTCTDGHAENATTKFIPPNAKILVEGERVTLFTE